MTEEIVDHRASSRYDAVKPPAYLGWWEEEEFHTSPAAVRNLSHGGALVELAALPPEGAEVWLCLAGTPPGQWVGAAVVDARGRTDDPPQVRLKFPESCPYEMFCAAVLGLIPEDHGATAAATGENPVEAG